jgi:acetate kinase
LGEHSGPIRSRIVSGLESFGVTLDEAANRNAAGLETRISRDGSLLEVWVMAVDEAQVLARAALALGAGATIGHGART